MTTKTAEVSYGVRIRGVINKTPLSAKTNRIIGGNAPSIYLPKIESQSKINPTKMNSILTTHIIPIKLLRTDQFDKFMDSRANEFIKLIENAMGKPVARDLPVNDVLDEKETDESDE